MINKIYQKSIQDVYNTSSQTLSAGSNVVFNGASVDSGTSIDQTSSTNFTIYAPGLYGVRFVGNLYNSTSSDINVNFALMNNDNVIAGTNEIVTVPSTGYTQIVIAKDVTVKEAVSGNAIITVNSVTASVLVDANLIIERKA